MIPLLELLGPDWTADHRPETAITTLTRGPTSLLLSDGALVGAASTDLAILVRELNAAYSAGAGRIGVEFTREADGRATARWVAT